MQNTYMNKMLQRIADAVERWTGGSITIDVTGAGDMQGATSASAGVHGLVPAPAAGDENKVLSGAGTWIDAGGGGGLDYSTVEQNTGVKWIDGSKIYQKTIDFGAMPVNAEKDVAHNIDGLAYVVDIEFIVYSATQGQWRLMPVISRGNVMAQSVYGVDSQYVFVLGGQNADVDSNWAGIVTLRYTKL